jgi:hypothetical protein
MLRDTHNESVPQWGRPILLRAVKLLRLHRVRPAVFGLGHVEEHRVRVKLRLVPSLLTAVR